MSQFAKFFSGFLCFFTALLCHADITVMDDAGNSVTLKEPAERIIALSPHLVENLYSIGVGDKIVGTVDHSDYPEAAKKIPRVGQFANYNIESIIALKPDLVLAWGSGTSAELINQLRALNLKVYVDEPVALKDIPESLKRLGVLTGAITKANEQASLFFDELKRTQHNSASTNISVFFQIWFSPLQTVNGQHMIDDVITHCGGRNIYGNEPAIAPVVSMESILVGNPALIVISADNQQFAVDKSRWQQWQNIEAVKNNNIVAIHPDLLQRQTLRILQGMRLLCESIQNAT